MMKPLACLIVFAALCSAARDAAAGDNASAGLELFESKIRPLLSDRCLKCHGMESGKTKGGLRLDTRDAILKGGDGGPSIVPGRPDESRLLAALRYTDPDLQMPPDGRIDDSLIEAVAEWIRLGAPDPRAEAPPGPPEPESDPAVAGGPPKPRKAPIDLEKEGAFWSFQPVAAHPPPEVRDAAWCINPIDRFILARIEDSGLSPAPRATRETLLRRATYDLTGLPPTPDELREFIADTSSEAYPRAIDRLLASPRYGEHQARQWLDVVRYTDSFDSRAGLEQDCYEAWRYRDWVVNAFNADMPYDRFVQMQIAGDLLGEGGFSAEGIIATGMLAFGNWPGGDADKQKMVTDIVDDQIDVISRGFMGLTVACARCHDHKFDPVSTQDYYGLAGIFFSSHILPGPGRKTEGSPILKIPLASPGEIARRKAAQEAVIAAEARVNATDEARGRIMAEALLPWTARYMQAAAACASELRDDPGLSIEALAEKSALNPAMLRQWMRYLGLEPLRLMRNLARNVLDHPGLHAWSGDNGTPSATLNTTDAQIDYLTIKQPARTLTIHPGPRDPVAVAWRSPVSGRVRLKGFVNDADPAGGDGIAWRIETGGNGGWIKLVEGEFGNGGDQQFSMTPGSAALDSIDIRKGGFIRLVVLPKENHTCDTTVCYMEIDEIGGTGGHWNLVADMLADPFEGAVGNPHGSRDGGRDIWHFIDLSAGADGPAMAGGTSLARWSTALRDGAATPEETARLAQAVQDEIIAATQAPPDSPSAKLRAHLLGGQGPFWLRPGTPLTALPLDLQDAVAADAAAKARAALEQAEAALPPPPDIAIGIQEGGVPGTEHEGIHDAAVHIRGNYAQLGEMVPRRFPAVLAKGEPSGIGTSSSGRAELARWITRPDHPLTARVMVNRIWQGHFGAGIVRTPGNFGALGERPTHPGLLDWLASAFIKSGWSVKSMHRMIMLSAAYQQGSKPSPQALEKDGDNRLLARMNRRRLRAEELRDTLLDVSEGISRSGAPRGGPAFTDLDLTSRTLYLRNVRSDRTSFTMLFDAADPTAVTDRRNESTVAPQALFLMNHPLTLKRARMLAERSKAWGGPEARISRLYELLYARAPLPGEIELGIGLLTASGGDDRAWEGYAQVLLCSNELMYVD